MEGKMLSKFLMVVLSILVSLVIGCGFISALLMLAPNIVTSYYCPTGLDLAISGYSIYPMNYDRSGVYLSCIGEGNAAMAGDFSFILKYMKSIGLVGLVMFMPVFGFLRSITWEDEHHPHYKMNHRRMHMHQHYAVH